MSLALVIGGTRSGKSAHAERLAVASGADVRYVATADAADPAMAARIDAHARRRPAPWTTVEAGDALGEAVAGARCVLLDGLGTWIAGVLHRAGAFDDPSDAVLAAAGERVRAEVEAIVEAARAGAAVVVVAEDAGAGVLPAHAASRAWLDLLGEATQRLSAAADRAELVVAGRAIPLRRAATRREATAAELAALRRHGDTEVRPGDADHAVNVVAGGPPAWLREALEAALATDARRYPDDATARKALAALHGRDAAEIVPTNGAAEALWLLPAALRPALAACVHPGFTEAEAALRAHGVPVARVLRDPGAGFALDPAAVPEAADLVIVGNPASPSGTLVPATAILALRRPGRVVVVDEAFMELVPGRSPSLVGERLDDVVVVRSLTKALAIPGLRAGYAVAAPALADAAARGAPAVVGQRPRPRRAGRRRAPSGRDRGDRRSRRGRARRPRRSSRRDRGRADMAVGGQLLPRRGPQRRRRSPRRCARGGIAVRPAASFPGLDDRHIRITARDPDANARLAAALAEEVAR